MLVIHGMLDVMVPPWHGKELYEAIDKQYRVPPFWVEGAGHNDVEVVCIKSGVLFIRIARFLDEVIAFQNSRNTPKQKERLDKEAEAAANEHEEWEREKKEGLLGKGVSAPKGRGAGKELIDPEASLASTAIEGTGVGKDASDASSGAANAVDSATANKEGVSREDHEVLWSGAKAEKRLPEESGGGDLTESL